MGLTAELLVRRGRFTLDVGVHVADGETLVLLGPNGSGKSTMLAAIAGLLAPERGTVEVNGRILTDVRDGQRVTAIAPHERGVGLLGQDALLFPHLSARENIAFGLRAKGVPARRARQEAEDWLQEVGLAEFADRVPAQLSGGQQQRVAIGRALAAEPRVLLLDEPMAALDVQNAAAVRTLLRERLATTLLPTIVVTHDVVDAMVLADRVAVLDEGHIVDIGETATVLGHPKNLFTAKLVGLNLMQGILEDGGIAGCGGAGGGGAGGGIAGGGAAGGGIEGNRSMRCSGGRRLRVPAVTMSPGDAVTASFPPAAVRISAATTEGTLGTDDTQDAHGRYDALGTLGTGGTHGFSWRATVGAFEPAVAGIRVPFVGETIAAEFTTAELLASGIREGMTVTVSIDPQFVTVYPTR